MAEQHSNNNNSNLNPPQNNPTAATALHQPPAMLENGGVSTSNSGRAGGSDGMPGKENAPPTSQQSQQDEKPLSSSNQRKRNRATAEQVAFLENVFAVNRSPNAQLREQMSKNLNMQPRQVQVWFQNRRAKEKMMQRRALTSGHLPPPPTAIGGDATGAAGLLTGNSLHSMGAMFGGGGGGGDQLSSSAIGLQNLQIQHALSQQQQQHMPDHQQNMAWFRPLSTANPLMQSHDAGSDIQTPTSTTSNQPPSMSINTSSSGMPFAHQGPRSAPPKAHMPIGPGSQFNRQGAPNCPSEMTGAEWTSAVLHGNATNIASASNSNINSVTGLPVDPSQQMPPGSANAAALAAMFNMNLQPTPPQSSMAMPHSQPNSIRFVHNLVVDGALQPQQPEQMDVDDNDQTLRPSQDQSSRMLGATVGEDTLNPVLLPIQLLCVGSWRRMATNPQNPDLICYATVDPSSQQQQSLPGPANGHFVWMVLSNRTRYKLVISYDSLVNLQFRGVSTEMGDPLNPISDNPGASPHIPHVQDTNAQAQLKLTLSYPPKYFTEITDSSDANKPLNAPPGFDGTSTASGSQNAANMHSIGKWVQINDFTADEQATKNSEHILIGPFWFLAQQLRVIVQANEKLQKSIDPITQSILGVHVQSVHQQPGSSSLSPASISGPQGGSSDSSWMPSNLHPRGRPNNPQQFTGSSGGAVATPPPSSTATTTQGDSIIPKPNSSGSNKDGSHLRVPGASPFAHIQSHSDSRRTKHLTSSPYSQGTPPPQQHGEQQPLSTQDFLNINNQRAGTQNSTTSSQQSIRSNSNQGTNSRTQKTMSYLQNSTLANQGNVPWSGGPTIALRRASRDTSNMSAPSSSGMRLSDSSRDNSPHVGSNLSIKGSMPSISQGPGMNNHSLSSATAPASLSRTSGHYDTTNTSNPDNNSAFNQQSFGSHATEINSLGIGGSGGNGGDGSNSNSNVGGNGNNADQQLLAMMMGSAVNNNSNNGMGFDITKSYQQSQMVSNNNNNPMLSNQMTGAGGEMNQLSAFPFGNIDWSQLDPQTAMSLLTMMGGPGMQQMPLNQAGGMMSITSGQSGLSIQAAASNMQGNTGNHGPTISSAVMHMPGVSQNTATTNVTVSSGNGGTAAVLNNHNT
ncbi:hypothetical protein H4219_003180 [Mycoemilia scoparia]|uniref:Homeobox domain-containing protein n=1 Tax=Mycoemilia scoparia TaxID=417184 RepID=A0A9W8A4X8_9FUNG|nr:hypothetical protein H4219_003180 [Mycoemilia scoparia]